MRQPARRFCKCKQELFILSSVLDGLLNSSRSAVSRTGSGSCLESPRLGSYACGLHFLHCMFRGDFCITCQ